MELLHAGEHVQLRRSVMFPLTTNLYSLQILATYEFVVDSYGVWSASALAGVGLIRNLCGAGFPLFANQMYHRLGYEWATSLLGFLAILLLPSG